MKRALVTGGNRGIGLAICKALAAKDYEVFLGSRNFKSGEQTAATLGVSTVEIDVADIESIENAVQDVKSVDVLVNNAGVLGSGGIFDDRQDFELCMEVMVNGPYHLMRLLTPAMVSQGYGRIVNVSSGWGAFSAGLSGPGAYGVAKAALNALTVAAARSLPSSVKVNSMCPGWVRTRMGGMNASRTVEEGAETAAWLATLDQDGPTGGFFRNRTRIEW